MKQAVFLDKDGTLIKNVPYNVDPEKIELEEFAGEGLKMISQLGFELIVITNQSGIERGYFNEEDLLGAFNRIQELLAPYKTKIKSFYFCPHFKTKCNCRKPEPELIKRAARDEGVDISKSFMIGDILNDIEAGIRVGCRTIFIDNGNETEWRADEFRIPHFIAADLKEAAQIISLRGARLYL